MNHITREEHEDAVIYYPAEQAALEPRLRAQIVVRIGSIQISNWSVTPSADIARELPEALAAAANDCKLLSRKSAKRKSSIIEAATTSPREDSDNVILHDGDA